jgi:hypothetical protein
VRTKYGAWYLPVSMWKPRPADEVLDVKINKKDCNNSIVIKESRMIILL